MAAPPLEAGAVKLRAMLPLPAVTPLKAGAPGTATLTVTLSVAVLDVLPALSFAWKVKESLPV